MSQRFESEELMYDGDVAKAYRVGVRMPDGKLVQRDFIRYAGAAVILPVLADGSIVLIENYRFAVEEHLLELPAGMLEPDEPPELCAARELTEETGYTAGRIEKLGWFYTGPGTCNETMHVFLATDLTEGEQALEVYERIEVRVTPVPDVRAMIADGRIHDAKTIAALSLYRLRET